MKEFLSFSRNTIAFQKAYRSYVEAIEICVEVITKFLALILTNFVGNSKLYLQIKVHQDKSAYLCLDLKKNRSAL